jgi:hypothetical protein
VNGAPAGFPNELVYQALAARLMLPPRVTFLVPTAHRAQQPAHDAVMKRMAVPVQKDFAGRVKKNSRDFCHVHRYNCCEVITPLSTNA